MTSPFESGSGRCYRCGQPGHWHDDPGCPLKRKAVSKAAHLARIAAFAERYAEKEITDWQKQQFIREENILEYGAQCRAALK